MHASSSILPLNVEHVSFVREDQRLLNDVSFTLHQGGISVIIGPNGAGKSLLLRLCNGLLMPTNGTISWAKNERLRHAMVFQRPIMLRRSVRANIQHTLKATGSSDSKRVDAALARFSLTHLANRPARLLSGGEQQRLAIARAWSQSPEVLFLDEPSSQLDPGNTREIETILLSLAADGITLVMTTHDLGQARRLAQRIIFMHRGRLLEDTDASNFFSAPQTSQARAFLAGELLQ